MTSPEIRQYCTFSVNLIEGQVQRSKVSVKVKGQGHRQKSISNLKYPIIITLRKSERLFVKYIGHRGLSVCLYVCLSLNDVQATMLVRSF